MFSQYCLSDYRQHATKLMRPLVRLWRSRGMRAIVYIDDGLLLASGFEQAMAYRDVVKHTLHAAGFITNNEKCQWEPKQRAKWLGFELDTQIGMISIPEEKITSLRFTLENNVRDQRTAS